MLRIRWRCREQIALPIALVLLARLALGLIFVRSAWGKAADLAGFARGLAAYNLLPAGAVAPLARRLPFAEAGLGVALLLGAALPLAGAGAAGLLAMFSIAIIINLRRGRVIACNCHGSTQQTPISWGMVVRNALLLGLALVLVGVAPRSLSVAALVATWQREAALMVSWALLPLALIGTGGSLFAALLTTTVDLRHGVRAATATERTAECMECG